MRHLLDHSFTMLLHLETLITDLTGSAHRSSNWKYSSLIQQEIPIANPTGNTQNFLTMAPTKRCGRGEKRKIPFATNMTSVLEHCNADVRSESFLYSPIALTHVAWNPPLHIRDTGFYNSPALKAISATSEILAVTFWGEESVTPAGRGSQGVWMQVLKRGKEFFLMHSEYENPSRRVHPWTILTTITTFMTNRCGRHSVEYLVPEDRPPGRGTYIPNTWAWFHRLFLFKGSSGLPDVRQKLDRLRLGDSAGSDLTMYLSISDRGPYRMGVTDRGNLQWKAVFEAEPEIIELSEAAEQEREHGAVHEPSVVW